ncbi:MAG TPA: CdaR family protein [Pyrinomonadaceae bacterium]|jgi:YbbR domain-containing protein
MAIRDTGSPIRLLKVPNATERLLRRLFLKDWNLKLLALAITLGLWFAVTGQRTPVTRRFRGVQLNFQLPDNMEISNDSLAEIDLTLTGAERDLDLINARDLTAMIDITDRRSGERVVQLTPGRLKMDLPNGVRLERIEPGAIQLRLEPTLERELEVEAKLEGKLPEGYALQKVTVNPPKIRVRGPASHVNALTKASTETISLDGRKESFNTQQIAIDIPDQKVVVLHAVVDIFVEIAPDKLK